ncbi:Spc98 family-domain-containing protein [Podospora aff. communis PSN243]|uniref:Spindle pole body component n=1 Tax=Podospora aff. communis PSN243 TaxID=3040156 RepID=A0AAV9GSS3_9PEZI|nr:Spc98 family-domain-containing protein [Podospora aff. communis PSN243]
MAQEEENLADPFAIPNFWKSSAWLDEAFLGDEGKNPLFSLDFSQKPGVLVSGNASIRETHVPLDAGISIDEPAVDGFFKLPSVLRELAAKESDTLTETPSSISIDDELQEAPIVEDVWLGAGEVPTKIPKLKTWDELERDDRAPTSAAFITEAGPAAFDALLGEGRDDHSATSEVIDDAAYTACLLALALGRSSLLFSWNPEKKSFVKTEPCLRTLGLSLQSLGGIDQLFVECANALKQLTSFAERTYSSSSTPTRVALAGAVDRLVQAVQSEINSRGQAARSLLQLQAIVRPAHTVLTFFRNLVGKLAKQKSEEKILSLLFQEAQSAEYQSVMLQEVAREVLRLVSKPWTDFVEEWVGLKAEGGAPISKTGPGKGFVKVADKIWIDDLGYELEEPDYFLDEDKLPSFVPEETARAAFEAGRNMRFLREHHPDHALSNQQTITGSNPPGLDWKFDWDSISELEDKAKQFHSDLSRVLENARQGRTIAVTTSRPKELDNPWKFEFFGESDTQISNNVLASINRLNQPLSNNLARDGLSTLLREKLYPDPGQALDSTRLDPHWSLAALLSFGPIINAQSSIVNRECMRMLFSAHELRLHIDLLKQHFLLDNGLLCSRLTHALFDPELETAERKSGVALGGGVMGLRLGGRDTWPPASSELRLALMGVLSESYDPPKGSNPRVRSTIASRSFASDLPGDLSFSVRDLSPEEIDRCMNPDSLEALDFLRLSYRAPPPLRPIITPAALVKYDRIFMSLLRVLRMLYVVNQLFHDVPLSGRREQQPTNASIRFCIEARHFVRQIATYFFDTGIVTPWRRFDAWLDSVEAESLSDEPSASGGKSYSPDVLRERQEQVLDEILSTLLLRKRQAPVLKLLEETFTVILRFAKLLRMDVLGSGTEKGDTPERLYASFKKKVEVFLTVCKGLGEKAGSGKSRHADGQGRPVENAIEQLLLLMDMSGFYARKQPGREYMGMDGMVSG